MKYIRITLLILFLNFTGCEEEELIDPSINYEEFTVVQSELSPNAIFPGVRLTKTLPIGTQFNIKAAEVKNATMFLRVNNIKIIPLHYFEDGLYKPLYDVYIHEGDKYELIAERDGNKFYAKTKIPFIPQIISTSYNQSSHFVQAIVRTSKNEVYSALWGVDVGSIKTASDFFEITVPQANDIINSIVVRSAAFPEEYQSGIFSDRRYIQVFSFDESFESYFNTKNHGDEVDNPFVQGSGNTIWNIQGSKVIGMFIGVSKAKLIKVD